MYIKCRITQESNMSSIMSGGWWNLKFEEWTRMLEQRYIMNSLEINN